MYVCISYIRTYKLIYWSISIDSDEYLACSKGEGSFFLLLETNSNSNKIKIHAI